jgi:glutathione-regulated potassium-efflux system ancillary protein KefF
MAMNTFVIVSHPDLARSVANRRLAAAVAKLPFVEMRHLEALYPDGRIDVAAEQAALSAASLIVWQHPLFWYTTPALLKLWFEKVLTPGWAWGPGGDVLRGKRCLWVVTTGGDARDYSPDGIHRHSFDAFCSVVRQTVEFCNMDWLEPIVVHEARQLDDDALAVWGRRYRAHLETLMGSDPGDHA